MADINSYALSLDFSLQTNAEEILGSVQDHLSRIEEQLVSVANTISGRLTDAASALNDNLQSVAANANAMASSTSDIGLDASNLSQSFSDINTDWQQIFDNLEDSREHFSDNLSDLQEMQEIVDVLRSGFGDVDDELGDISGSIGSSRSGLAGMVLNLAGIAGSVISIKEAFIDAWKEEDQFITIGRRLYGTQQDMASATRQMTVETGLYGEIGQEAMIAVSERIRFTNADLERLEANYRQLNDNTEIFVDKSKLARDELKKYAELTAKFSTVTGVAVEQVAVFEQRLMNMGYNFDDTQEVMSRLAAAFREAGMSAEEVTGMLSAMGKEAVGMRTLWGKEGSKGILEYSGAFASMLKTEAKLLPEQAQNIATSLTNNQMFFRKYAKNVAHEMGLSWKEIHEDTELSQKVYGESVNRFLKEQAQRWKANAGAPDQQQLQLQNLAGVFNITKDAAESLMQNIDSLGIESGEFNGLMGDQIKLMQKNADMNKDYADAVSGVSKAWAIAVTKFDKVWTELASKLGPIVIWFIEEAIMPLTDAIIWLLDPFEDSVTMMEDTSKAVSETGGWIQWFTGKIRGLGGAITALTVTIGGLAAAWVVIKVGIGLWKQFMVATDAVKLMAIAAAAAAVGAGALMIAYAFKMVADLGWRVITPLLVFGGVIAGLTVAIMALSAAGPVTIPVMIVLSGTFLALGVASLMLAKAIDIVTTAMDSLAANPILQDPSYAINLMAFGAAVLAGGTMILLGSVPLMAGATLMNVAMPILSAALWWLDLDRFSQIAESFLLLGAGMVYLSESVGSIHKIRRAIVELASSLIELEEVPSVINRVVYSLMFGGEVLYDSARSLSAIVYDAYYVMALAVEQGLNAVEARADRSRSLFGSIIADFQSMAFTLGRIALDVKAKRIVEEAMQRQYTVSLGAVQAANEATISKESRAEPIQHNMVREDKLDRLRERRDKERQSKMNIEQLQKINENMEKTASNTSKLDSIEESVNKQATQDSRPQTSVGGSHVTNWSR